MSQSTGQLQEMQALGQKARELETEFVRLLEERADIARRRRSLAEQGFDSGEPDEQEWLRGLEAGVSGQLRPESLRAILRHIRSTLRSIEEPGRIAYVGPAGGLCHAAARFKFGAERPALECGSVEAALDAVARGRAVTAAIPFESSSDGLVQSSVTALANSELVIVGERSIQMTFDLVGQGPRDRIERILLTSAARRACRNYLADSFEAASVLEVTSPHEALEGASVDARTAAIVLADCAAEASLGVLESNVEDAPTAFTRFAFVAARPAPRSERNRTCLLFTVRDEPGSLFEVLRHFAERGLNLGRVQSRPLPRTSARRADYAFYLEVDGHEAERSMVAALDRVRRSTRYLRLLGSYPVEETTG